ncbi:unnamed protein product, partial [Polarella glacialis]
MCSPGYKYNQACFEELEAYTGYMFLWSLVSSCGLVWSLMGLIESRATNAKILMEWNAAKMQLRDQEEQQKKLKSRINDLEQQQLSQMLVTGPHALQVQDKLHLVPGLGSIVRVLDLIFQHFRTLLRELPFEVQDQSPEETVWRETEDDRQTAADSPAHHTCMKALDLAAGSGLPSLEGLRQDLQWQGQRNPDFFAAIGGAELCSQLTQMLEKYQGPHHEEDANLAAAVETYVKQVIQSLYQHSQQAARDIRERRKLEQGQIKQIRKLSEQLAEEWLVDRAGKEACRNQKVEGLMEFFSEKVHSVISQERQEEVLRQSQAEFVELNARKLDCYSQLAVQQQNFAIKQRAKCPSFEQFEAGKAAGRRLAWAQSAWARLACGVRLLEVAGELQASLGVGLDAMEEVREAQVELDRKERELAEAKVMVKDALDFQGQRAAEHEALAHHYSDSGSLMADFEEVVKTGFAGLRRKSEMDAAAVVEDLPQDQVKMHVLSAAYEEDLHRQKQVVHAAAQETLKERLELEKRLRTAEQTRRTDSGGEFQAMKTSWEEMNADLKQNSEDVDMLDRRLGACSSTLENYTHDYQVAGALLGSGMPSQGRDEEFLAGNQWVSEFLYHERACTRFQPPQRMLTGSALDQEGVLDGCLDSWAVHSMASSTTQAFELLSVATGVGGAAVGGAGGAAAV